MERLGEDDFRAIRASQMRAVAHLIPVTASINLLNALIVIAAFLTSGQTIALLVWGVTVVLAVGLSIVSWLRFRHSPPTGLSKRSLDRIAIYAFILAAIWASVPILFFPGTTAVNQVLVTCLVAVMMGGGALCLATIPRAGLVYTWTFAAGGATALFLDSEPKFIFGVLLLVLYAIFVSRTLVAHGKLFIANQINQAEMTRQTETISLLLKNFEENSSDWLWETDEDGRFVRLSDRLTEVTGRTRAELKTLTIWDLLGIAEKEYCPDCDALMKNMANRVPFRDLTVPIRVAGEQHVWSITAAPEFDRNANYIGYRGIGTDITEKWKTQQRLAEQAEQFETALENMPQGLCMFDKELRLRVCNRRYIEMYGLEPEDVTPGTPILELTRRRARSGHFSETEVDKIENLITLAPASAQFVSELNDGRIISVSAERMPGGGCVVIHNDISEQRRAEERMHYLAHHDALTGLPNRLMMRDQLVQHLEDQHATFAVLALDLDLFKNVNDTLGHPAGDALLRSVADRLRGALDGSDFVARQGGDEFVILQMSAAPHDAATELAARVIEWLKQPYQIAGTEVVIGVSIGVAVAPRDGNDADQLLKCADLALYRAKEQGRNSFAFFEDGMDLRMHERHILELDLRNSMENGELEPFELLPV